MEVKQVFIPDLLIVQPDVFTDPRGCFFETYNKQKFKQFGIESEFMQDNQSVSSKGTLRGLHFQNPPFQQGKLVRVIKGSALDIAVDIRKKSQYYGKYFSIILSEKNNKIFWIPPGFAHGFLSLENNTIFVYKCTQIYNKESEKSIRWDDPDLNINWEYKNPLVSERDKAADSFKQFNSMF
ncbi:MAG: dTDP-4-dehydrorhamnose 3,5-epimerase [Bacteroidetes bacterium]|nr:dTDP-4-dehydrorhamnose 3,5-epimerase [Bacteroidota bacterium]